MITAHTLANGPRNLIIQYNLVSGGADYTNYELLNVTDYTGEDQVQPTDFKVTKVCGNVGVGTSFQLKFGSVNNNHRQFFETPTDNEFEECWPGGVSTELDDRDMTIRLSTSGFDAANDHIHLIIHAKKKVTGVRA